MLSNKEHWRDEIMANIANGLLSVPDGTDQVEAVRWVWRVSNHLARISLHFSKVIQ